MRILLISFVLLLCIIQRNSVSSSLWLWRQADTKMKYTYNNKYILEQSAMIFRNFINNLKMDEKKRQEEKQRQRKIRKK
jgi:hypothetical protein